MNEGFKNKYRNFCNQAPPQARPKAAPKKQAAPEAARRWLEGVTKKSDLSVAAQTRRAELHEVSCRDEPTQYGEGVEFFQGYQITRHWKNHSICLKWKRERAEIHGEVPVIFHDDPDEPDHFQPLLRKANGGDQSLPSSWTQTKFLGSGRAWSRTYAMKTLPSS